MHADKPTAISLLPDERVDIQVINGLNILYRQWGAASAFPIVLLHGLRGYSGTWRSFAARFSGEYRLIAIDQRGRGGSDWDPAGNYYTDAYLSDLEALVDYLALDQFVLLGHSMGGTTSYVYAAKHPQRLAALIIEDIAPGASISGPGATRIVAEMSALPDSFGSWAEARAYWRKQRPTIGDAAIEERVAESLRQGDDGRIYWRYDAQGIRQTRVNPDVKRVVDLWPIIDRIAVPTMVIRGEKSDFCSADAVSEMLRRNSCISSVTVPGAGHYVHDHDLQTFSNHVADFLTAQLVDKLSR